MKKETYEDKIKDLDDRIDITIKLFCNHLDWEYSEELKELIQTTVNLSILRYMFKMKNTKSLLDSSMDKMMNEYPDFFLKMKNDDNGI